VSPAAIGQYEAGIIKPRLDYLDRLADALGVPVRYFAAGRPRADLDAACAHFKSLRSMRLYERHQATAYTEDVWELSQALEGHVRLPDVDLPKRAADGRGLARITSPVEAARLTRRAWHLWEEPVAHLVRLLESHGIVVATLPFNDSGRVDAFSTNKTPRPIVVLTADRDDVYRRRFCAAHELGHLLLHPEAAPGDRGHEREANSFASELLLPAHRMREILPRRLDLAKLIALQMVWGVSVEALLYRGRELGLYSDDAHRRGRVRLHYLRAQNAVAESEPVAAYTGEQPRLLRRAFDVAAETGLTLEALGATLAWAPARAATMLGIGTDVRPVLTMIVGSAGLPGATSPSSA